MKPVSIPDALSTLEPVAWFLSTAPIFMYTIRQGPKSRWWLLPLNILPPCQSYRTANQLSAQLPGLDWLLTFTSLVYMVHATSALYLESWVIPPRPPGAPATWDTVTALKAWMNPRRLRQRSNPTPGDAKSKSAVKKRHIFVIKRLLLLAVLAALYMGVELGILFYLNPGPRDFGAAHQTYLHAGFDRSAAFRIVFAFHWAWLTYLILTAANSALAIVFIGLLQIDEPDEWPPLYGSPFQAYTIQRFWGTFWHQIGTPSQLHCGRFITRRVFRLEPGSAVEKTALALWVFAVSGTIHALVTWKTEPEADPLSDLRFLMLNFLGGLAEMAMRRANLVAGGRRPVSASGRLLGYLCMLAFFYCIVPPYQFPVLYRAAVGRMPFRVNMNMNMSRRA